MQRDRIAAFLNARPQTANRLSIVTTDVAGAAVPVASWMVDELAATVPEQVRDVTEAAQEDANERGKGRYSFLWELVERNEVSCKKRKSFLFEPEVESAAGDAQRDAQQAFDTTAPNVALIFAQVVRHAENMHRMYIASLGQVVAAQRDVITALSTENRELYRRARTMTHRALDAEGRVPEGSDGDIEAVARAAAWDKVSDFLVGVIGPLAAEKVAGAAGANGRAAAPGATS